MLVRPVDIVFCYVYMMLACTSPHLAAIFCDVSRIFVSTTLKYDHP